MSDDGVGGELNEVSPIYFPRGYFRVTDKPCNVEDMFLAQASSYQGMRHFKFISIRLVE